MNTADRYYFMYLYMLLTDGYLDENPRPKYKDGTPAFTQFITQVVEKYDIGAGEFPIPTIRNTAIKTGIKEILWIYQKQNSDLFTAHALGVNWWDEWNIGNDTIGNRYGHTVKRWNIMDNLLSGLVKDPFGRRHIMNLYQYEEFNETPGLIPCAYETLFSCRRGKDNKIYLDMTLIQRSNDYIMAGYINKIQYVALMMMVAGHCGYELGNFVHFVQNLHIYDRHSGAASELLNRKPLDIQPKLILKEQKNFYSYTIDDFEIEGINGIMKLDNPLEIAI